MIIYPDKALISNKIFVLHFYIELKPWQNRTDRQD